MTEPTTVQLTLVAKVDDEVTPIWMEFHELDFTTDHDVLAERLLAAVDSLASDMRTLGPESRRSAQHMTTEIITDTETANG